MLLPSISAQDKKKKRKKIDRIFLKVGKVVEGEIKSENYKFVKLKGKKPIKTTQIEDIDYYDMPETYTNAMEKLRLMDYESALGSFKLASKKDIQRPWLKINCLFYQALCQFHLKQYNICIANIKNLLKEAPKTRFLPDALRILLDCYINLNNETECINVLSKIEELSKELDEEGKNACN
jgi:tetratricopeptide (TPR) repeat protein